jgi:hypothetical protein
MTQADSVHSTPRLNTSATRRRFLSQSAGMAAGGAILALATNCLRRPPTHRQGWLGGLKSTGH